MTFQVGIFVFSVLFNSVSYNLVDLRVERLADTAFATQTL